ncbi:MAG: tetratricopeptide repeat protein [Spirochaetes bacterium]|jgi:tetratricopeptide (TPR) repeat protein|nr:tetratricopeptide repeat protein [Spirochaetota bacterium]
MKHAVAILSVLLLSLMLNAQQSSSMLYDQALEAIRAKNYKSAELILRSIIKNDDAYKEQSFFQLAKSIHYQKRYQSAIFEFNRYLTISTDDSLRIQTRYWIARSYYYDGNHHYAIEEFKRYLSENPSDPALIVDSYRQIGFIYFRQRRYDEALIEWERAIEYANDQVTVEQIRYDMALAHFNSINYPASEKILKQIIAASESPQIRARAHILYGRIEQKRSRHKQAITHFSRVEKGLLNQNPLYNVFYYMSLSFIELKDDQRAIQSLRLFIDHSSENDSSLKEQAQLELARILSRNDEQDNALSLFLDLIESSNNSILKAESIYLAGNIYLGNSDLYKARSVTEKILDYEVDYDSRNAYILLSDIYVQLAMYSRAEEILLTIKKELAYDPEMDMIQYKLSYVYLREKKYSKSIEGFKQVDAFNPFSPYKNESNYFIAVAHYENKNYKDALKYCTTYLRQPKLLNAYDAHVIRLDCYVVLNRFKEARREADYIITTYPKGSKNPGIIYDYALFLKANKSNNSKYIIYILNNFPESEISTLILRLEGEKLYNEADYISAEKSYERLLNQKRSSYDPAITERYFELLYLNKRYDKIEKLVSNFETTDERVRPILTLYAARVAYQKGFYQTASFYYSSLISSTEQSVVEPSDYYFLILSELKLDNADSAQLILADYQLEEYYLRSASAISHYYSQKRGPQAGANFANNLLTDTSDADKKDGLALLTAGFYLDAGENDKSYAIIKQLTSQSPESVGLMTRVLLSLNRHDELFDYLETNSALYLDGSTDSALLDHLAEVSLVHSQDKLFLQFNELLKNRKGYRSRSNSYYAYYYYLKKDFVTSNRFSKAAFVNEKNDPRLLFIMAEMNYYHIKNINKAQQLYKMLLELPYDHANFVARGGISYALILFKENKPDHANRQLELLTAEYPDGAFANSARNIQSHYRKKNETN